MKLIETRPSRLHCEICKDTYNLPQSGQIKTFKELRCPLDEFELVQYVANSDAKVMTFASQRVVNCSSSRLSPFVRTVTTILRSKTCRRTPAATNALIRPVPSQWHITASVRVMCAIRASFFWMPQLCRSIDWLVTSSYLRDFFPPMFQCSSDAHFFWLCLKLCRR